MSAPSVRKAEPSRSAKAPKAAKAAHTPPTETKKKGGGSRRHTPTPTLQLGHPVFSEVLIPLLDLPTLCNLSACSKQALELCEGAAQWDKGIFELAHQHGHCLSNDAKIQSKSALGRDESFPTRRSSRVKLGWAVRSARRDVAAMEKFIGFKETPLVYSPSGRFDMRSVIPGSTLRPSALGRKDTDHAEHWENLANLYSASPLRWSLMSDIVGLKIIQDSMEGRHNEGGDPAAQPFVHKIFKEPDSYKVPWTSRALSLAIKDYMLADFGCGEVSRVKRSYSHINIVGSDGHLTRLVTARPKWLTPSLWGEGDKGKKKAPKPAGKGGASVIDSLDLMRLPRKHLAAMLMRYPQYGGASDSEEEYLGGGYYSGEYDDSYEGYDSDEDMIMAMYGNYHGFWDGFFGGYGGYMDSDEEGHYCSDCGGYH
mmetsp:Transcript_6840/g.16543  ORF Transcript_6840/g.16543 Transcript_6840/m.16543 type:complete len:425 (+) Transcript_6840:166-1440(+)